MSKIMRKSIKIASFILILLFICMNLKDLDVKAADVGYTENETSRSIDINDEFDEKSLMVVLKPDKSKFYGVVPEFLEKLLSIKEVESYDDLSELSVESLERSGIDTKYYSRIENHLNSINFKQILKINLNTTTKQEVVKVIKIIERFEEVMSVTPNYICKSDEVTVTDTNFNEQWALFDTYGIDATKAWDFTTGSSRIRVGIIDSGIANHLDLNSNVVEGRDFFHNDTITTDDIAGHGTSVAGIIGAVANNRRGVAGINHNISLVPLQTANDEPSVNGMHYTSDIIEAIEHARDLWLSPNERISIINYSISNFGYNTSVLAAIETYQGLFVWSAGNNGENLDEINGIEEFSLDNLISVGAHDNAGERSIWNSEESSNYGEIVNIYAPSRCYTTHSTSNNSYRTFGGTSAAAPHVAGVAALLLSMDSNLTALDLKNIILNSAEIINITLPNESTQSVKKLNAFNAIKYYLFEYYTPNLYSLTSNGLSVENTIYPDSSCYNNQNMFIKLNVTNSCDYEFVAFANNYSIDVKLFDSNLNEVSISKTYMETNRRITFNINLSSGEYYVRVYSSYSEPQIVDLDIQTNHTHSYTRYRTYSSTQHKAICSCGASILQYHMVDTSGCCVLCLAIVSSGISPLTLNNVNYITENGSYILPNGVIIIVEADMDSFIKNKTDIYSLL